MRARSTDNRVRIAVVPAAGLGTRLAPATWAVPKELMPIGPHPMIQLAMEEIRDCGIERAVVVVSPAKPALAAFLRRWGRGRSPKVTLVAQPRPLGLADALLRTRRFASSAPFALLLPDNVFVPSPGAEPALCQVMRAFEAAGRDSCGLMRIKPEHAGRYSHAGLVEVAFRRPGPHRISKLYDKRLGPLRVGSAGAVYKTFARAVLGPAFFEDLERSSRGRAGADEVPALQRIVRRGGLYGTLLEGRGFDAGNPRGYAAAVECWARRATRRAHPTK
jgi:UTP--glucose-1-phosphate uridylyltransferase